MRWSSCELVKERLQLLHIDQRAAQAARERRLLRRREEAQRDLPDARAAAEAGHPRRDRLGPRHRRAEDRRRRRQRDALARPRDRRRDALPAAAQLHRARLRARADRRPHRASPAARSWRSSSRRRATAGSKKQRPRRRPGGRKRWLLFWISARRSRRPAHGSSRSSRRARRASSRPAWLRQQRERAHGGLRRAGLPDDARRGMALHARRRRSPTRRSCAGELLHVVARRPRTVDSSARRPRRSWCSSTASSCRRSRAVADLPAGPRGRRAQPRARRRRSDARAVPRRSIARGQRLAVHGAEHGALRGRRVRPRRARTP